MALAKQDLWRLVTLVGGGASEHGASSGHLNSCDSQLLPGPLDLFNKMLIFLSLDPDLLPMLLLRGLGRGLSRRSASPSVPAVPVLDAPSLRRVSSSEGIQSGARERHALCESGTC